MNRYKEIFKAERINTEIEEMANRVIAELEQRVLFLDRFFRGKWPSLSEETRANLEQSATWRPSLPETTPERFETRTAAALRD